MGVRGQLRECSMLSTKTQRSEGSRSRGMGGLQVLQQRLHLELSHVLARAVAAVVERWPVLSRAYAQSGPSSAETSIRGELAGREGLDVSGSYLYKELPILSVHH